MEIKVTIHYSKNKENNDLLEASAEAVLIDCGMKIEYTFDCICEKTYTDIKNKVRYLLERTGIQDSLVLWGRDWDYLQKAVDSAVCHRCRWDLFEKRYRFIVK